MFLAWCNHKNSLFAASVSLAYTLTTLLSPLRYLLLYDCNETTIFCANATKIYISHKKIYIKFQYNM